MKPFDGYASMVTEYATVLPIMPVLKIPTLLYVQPQRRGTVPGQSVRVARRKFARWRCR